MAHIQISRQHDVPMELLRDKINHMMVSLQDKLSFNTEWESESEFTFRRKGANGLIRITANQLELSLNLGLMYRAMSAQIESRIVAEINSQLT
ncbi:MAG: polyhydroxyalkanoic acid system family protein [Kangiellaceae bacterium]|jgi:putative polyhydroxyalkanoate system protein